MPKWVLMIDKVSGNIGLYDEPVPAASEADYSNPSSACNAPLNNPGGHLAQIYWHIQFDNLEVFMETNTVVNHAEVPTSSGVIADSSASGPYDYGGYTPVETVLCTHNLGYVPPVFVAVDGGIVTPGYVLQVTLSGSCRYVSVYVTNTQVILREWAQRGLTVVPAVSKTYKAIVCRNQRPAEGNNPPKFVDFDATTGILNLGDGRWSNARRYMQVVPGGTPFGLAVGKTLDLANGAMRFAKPDGTFVDPVPAGAACKFTNPEASTNFGASMAYNGSFSAAPFIQVQAP